MIATRPLAKGKALAISKGVDRDRAVDESGNQIAVFGRVGARPLNLDEQRRMYMHNGKLWTVTDNPADYDAGYRPSVSDDSEATIALPRGGDGKPSSLIRAGR